MRFQERVHGMYGYDFCGVAIGREGNRAERDSSLSLTLCHAMDCGWP